MKNYRKTFGFDYFNRDEARKELEMINKATKEANEENLNENIEANLPFTDITDETGLDIIDDIIYN